MTPMRVVGALALEELIARAGPSLAGAAAAWHAEASAAAWTCEADLRRLHPAAGMHDGRVVFDLGHDDHCVIARVNYEMRSVLTCYIGPRATAPWPVGDAPQNSEQTT